MEGKDSIKTKPRKKTLKRIIQVILGIFLLLLIFILFIVPAMISSEKGRQIIVSKINESIKDGKADFSDFSIGWFKGVKISDLSYDDDAGFISVKIKNVSTKPNYGALISGNFNLGQTKVDTPQIEIDLNKMPESTASTKTSSNTNNTNQPINSESAAFALTTDFNLKDGNFKLIGTDSNVELKQINSDINIRPLGEQSNFNLGMIVSTNNNQSKVEIKGKVKSEKKSGWKFKTTDSDIGINIENLDLESIQPFLEMAGIEIKSKGSITVDIQSKTVAGQLENATGTIKGSNLEIENIQTHETIKTSVLDVDVKVAQKEQMINVEKMNLKTDWAQVQAGGAFPTSIKSLDSFLKSNADYDLNGTFDCDIAAIAKQLPVTMSLKDNTQITSGNITGEIKTTGPAGQKQIQAQATLDNLKGIVDGKQASLSEPILAKANVSPNQDGVNIDNLDVSSSFISLNAKGNLDQINFDGQANLDKLQAELSQFVDIGPYKLSGQFKESGQVSLSDKDVKLSGSSTIKGLNITGPNNVTASVPTGEVTYTLNLDKQKNILNIASLNADMDFGQADIKDTIIPLNKDEFDLFNAIVNARQINLSKLQPFAVLFGGMPENYKLAGIAESQITVSSQKQILIAKSNSTSLKNLKVTFPDNKAFERSEATATFELNIDPKEKEIDLRTFKLDSPDLNVPQARISQTKMNGITKLNGNIDLQYDWAILSEILGPFMPEGLELKGKETNNINFVSEFPTGQNDKLLSNMNAKADLGFEQAGYMGLDIGKTDINISVTDGVLLIPPFSTTVNKGKLNFGAKADFKKQPASFTIDEPTQVIENIQLNDETTHSLLIYLNPLFAGASNVSGTANLHCEKLNIPLDKKHKNDAEIVATVSASQLTLNTSNILNILLEAVGGRNTGTVLTIHPTKISLKDGFLRYDDMQVDIDDIPVNFSGVVGLDNSLKMSVTIPYTFSGTTARVGRENSDRIELFFGGTVQKPELDISKIFQENLINQIPNILERGLEGLFN